MSDQLRSGLSWLAAQLTQHASTRVLYRRDALETSLQATIGKSTYVQDDQDGMRIRAQVRDYLIDTEALILGGSATLPRAGDKIIETEDRKRLIYEVMSLGDTPWRYSDPFRLKFRIHTKLVHTEIL